MGWFKPVSRCTIYESHSITRRGQILEITEKPLSLSCKSQKINLSYNFTQYFMKQIQCCLGARAVRSNSDLGHLAQVFDLLILDTFFIL